MALRQEVSVLLASLAVDVKRRGLDLDRLTVPRERELRDQRSTPLELGLLARALHHRDRRKQRPNRRREVRALVGDRQPRDMGWIAVLAQDQSPEQTRGQIVQVGIFKQPTAIDLRAVNFHEVDLIGARVYTREDYDRTIMLAAEGRFDLNSIEAEVLLLDEAVTAFASAKAATAVKTMFKVQE